MVFCSYEREGLNERGGGEKIKWKMGRGEDRERERLGPPVPVAWRRDTSLV